MTTSLKIAVIGTGAMGSIYAARLSNAGHSVCAIDVWNDHVEAMNVNGLTIDGPDGRMKSAGLRAAHALPTNETFDLYVIATKSFGVRDSAAEIAKTLTPDAMVLTSKMVWVQAMMLLHSFHNHKSYWASQRDLAHP